MDNETRPYPPQVTKGQTLTIPELEKVLGVKYPHPMWWSKILNLRNRIYRDRERQGLPAVTIRTERFQLVVCDDSEAATYNRSMGKRGLRRFAKAAARNVAVDESKLTEEERQAHRRTIMRQALLLRGIKRAQHCNPPELSPPERITPKMLAASDN
jgi:hypothetical protein